MDPALLDRLAAEASIAVTGAAISRTMARPGGGVALILSRDSLVLDLAPGPPRGWLALTRLRLPAAEPSESLPASFHAFLAGRRLEAIELLGGDRVVRLRLDGGSSLVLEILGGAGNIYALDATDVIVIRGRAAGRPGGELREGDVWRPPASRVEAPPGAWRSPVGPLPTRPGLAAPALEDEIDPLVPLAARDLMACPDGSPAASGCFIETGRLGDAVIRRALWLAKHERAARRHQEVAHHLTREHRRLDRLIKELGAEREGAGRHAVLRRQAEALLAGLKSARREGEHFVVPDPYGGEEPIRVPSPPGREARLEADALFRKAGRLERALPLLAQRLGVAESRRVDLDTSIAAVEAATTLAEVEAVAAGLPPASGGAARHPAPGGRQGTAHPPRREDLPRKLAKDPRARRIRRFRLAGDWVAYAGTSAEANAFLTFRVAAPHDFWLHAADYPGSHVVVRNPARRESPPPDLLAEAAGVAAHFSQAPRGERVVVRWTQARHVRKGRGLPVGTVLLPRFSTTVARPALPRGEDPLASS